MSDKRQKGPDVPQPMMPDPDAWPARTYEVGKNKPPKHTRFKPGKSGNPRGRPQRRSTLFDLVQQVTSQLVPIGNGAGRQEVAAGLALFKLIMNSALRCDRHAQKLMVMLMLQAEAFGEQPMTEEEELDDLVKGLSREDIVAINAIRERMSGYRSEEESDPESAVEDQSKPRPEN